MKTIKPLKLGLLHKTIEHEGRAYFIASVFLHFPFDRPRALLSEMDLWRLAGEELTGEMGLLDEGNAKQRGEVLVTGKCFAPRGEPVPIHFVRVQLGSVDKRLAVIGDRQWKLGVPTQPEPFVEMPVDWEHAFGGEGFPQNPRGRGFAPIQTKAGKVHPLPNIEDPKRLIASPGNRPVPAGLRAMDLTWPQRFELVGTYDTKWLETRFPGYAADLDPAFFNTAPKDQWIEGYFRGDEAFVVENMHPTSTRLTGNLPGAVVRVFAEKREKDGESVFREIPMRIDTVRLFPHHEKGVLVYRGGMEVLEDDAADIKYLLVACEDPAFPRDVDHYKAVLARRLDREKAALYALKDEDLMPPAEAGWSPRIEKDDVAHMIKSEGLLAANMRRREEKQLAESRAKVAAMGLDPKDFGLDTPREEEPEIDPDNLDAVIAKIEAEEKKSEVQRKELEAKQAEMEAEAREVFAAQGQDFDKAMKDAQKEASGPPKFRAKAQLAWMREMAAVARAGERPMEDLEKQLEDPAYIAQLEAQERQLLEAYQKGAHMNVAADPLDEAASEPIRAELGLAHHNEISLSGRDFTGANLAGLSLPGIDLSGAFLESADLTGTDLSGANLKGAVLAHAKLHRTRLVGAKLDEANLGGATLVDADLSGASMQGTVLGRARLRGTRFHRAHLQRADFMETVFEEGVDLGEVVAEDLVLLKIDLSRVRLAGAKLEQAVFLEVDARGADFSGVDLTKASFLTVQADGANFRGGKLDGVQFVHESSLEGADFSEASLKGAVIRGAKLARAKFDRALMEGADLSEADCTEASLYQIVARGALFMRTDLSQANMVSADLLGAILQKSKLHGTNLKGSSLFRADLAKVRVDGSTNIDDANMKLARVYPRANDGSR